MLVESLPHKARPKHPDSFAGQAVTSLCNLAADLARFVRLGMDVEVPFSSQEISSLLRISQRSGSFDWTCDAALDRNDDARGLAGIGRPVEMGGGSVAC